MDIRHDWTLKEVQTLFDLPLLELVYQAQTMHRQHFKNNTLQLSTLYNVKTGACPEDCGYCAQSRHHKTDLNKESLVSLKQVIEKAKEAKAQGATRFCMGAAWRQPKDHQLNQMIERIKAVKALGLETCVTLGMLNASQAQSLKAAGLDFYNHNLDTSPRYYPYVTKTRTYEDRLNTLQHVREVGLKVCCGGILGMGEQESDRLELLIQLANLPEHPQSVPINALVPVPGTPLGNSPKIDAFDFIKLIALARIMMPKSYVRLSAGRHTMDASTQALCFMAGANSIFSGPKLLTVKNQALDDDQQLLKRLKMQTQEYDGDPIS